MGWHPHDPLPVDCHFLVRTVAPDSSSFSTQPALDGIPSLTCLHRNPCPVQATAQPSLSPNPVQQSATSSLLPLPMMGFRLNWVVGGVYTLLTVPLWQGGVPDSHLPTRSSLTVCSVDPNDFCASLAGRLTPMPYSCPVGGRIGARRPARGVDLRLLQKGESKSECRMRSWAVGNVGVATSAAQPCTWRSRRNSYSHGSPDLC